MILHWRGLYWQSFLSPTIIGNASLSQKIFLTCILIGWWYNDLCECLKNSLIIFQKLWGGLYFHVWCQIIIEDPWVLFVLASCPPKIVSYTRHICQVSHTQMGPTHSTPYTSPMPTPIVDYDRLFFNKDFPNVCLKDTQ